LRVRVVWSPRAIRRVTEAARYIAEENPRAAVEWAQGLFDSARPLARFPELGRVVPEVGRPEIREIIFRGYRVVYRVAPHLVEVLTVRHGKRKLSSREVGASSAK
jgi:plasmid stabilization system protein ParE